MKWKNDFANRTDADMAIVTQFAFEAGPIIDWANAVQASGIDLPIHIGIAGPAKLQTLIKFAIACGVGPSLKVLQKRAMDVTKLVLPYEPDDIVTALALTRPPTPTLPSHICISSRWVGLKQQPNGLDHGAHSQRLLRLAEET